MAKRADILLLASVLGGLDAGNNCRDVRKKTIGKILTSPLPVAQKPGSGMPPSRCRSNFSVKLAAFIRRTTLERAFAWYVVRRTRYLSRGKIAGKVWRNKTSSLGWWSGRGALRRRKRLRN
jgi:hypothetical protein